MPWTGKRNPSTLTDVGYLIVPAAAGFAATRVASRIASSIASKRRPSWTKHVNVLTGIASFFGLWFLGHRWRKIAPYHTPIVVGSGIAAMQSAIQTYVPKYGWLLGHPSEEMTLPAGPTATSDYLPTGDEMDDEFIFEDGDAEPVKNGRNGGGAANGNGVRPGVTDTVEDMLDNLEIDDDELNQGIFSN